MSDKDEGPSCVLSPSQSVRLMSLGVLLRDGDLNITGELAQHARELLIDVSQEIALQMK